jgi:hypothetical protein
VPIPHRGTREATWDIDLKGLSHQIFKAFLSPAILFSIFCVDADGFKFFIYSGFLLIFKDKVLKYMAQNAS